VVIIYSVRRNYMEKKLSGLCASQVVESIICKETIFWTGCQKVDEKDYWDSIFKLNLNIL
jgi:hypothetical protein